MIHHPYDMFLSVIFIVMAGCSRTPDHTKGSNETKTETTRTKQEQVDDFSPSPRIASSDECPKGAFRTKDGLCSCYYGSYNEAEGFKLYGKLLPDGSDVLGSSFRCSDRNVDGYNLARMAVCSDIHGCKARDGRWYNGLAQATFTESRNDDPLNLPNPYSVSDDAKTDIPYIPGGMDTSMESGLQGNCVLDRTDGIPLFSDVPKINQNYACNRPSCPCGESTCKNGQICKDGQCQWDEQDPPVPDDSNSQYVSYHKLNGPSTGPDDVYDKIYGDCIKATDGYCVDDGDGDFRIRSFNTVACKGGKHYCHGRGNFPMAKPNEDYVCRQVAEIPGLKTDLPVKAWVCNHKEGCECGSNPCPHNAACINGKCY